MICLPFLETLEIKWDGQLVSDRKDGVENKTDRILLIYDCKVLNGGTNDEHKSHRYIALIDLDRGHEKTINIEQTSIVNVKIAALHTFLFRMMFPRCCVEVWEPHNPYISYQLHMFEGKSIAAIQLELLVLCFLSQGMHHSKW